MAQERAPDDFDWVTAQAGCTSETMFARLLAGVRQDIERRNALPEREDGARFELEEEVDRFEVTRLDASGSRVLAFVEFERAGQRINVRGDGVDVRFTAIASLDVHGKCRFVVGEAEYSEWEVRRMALELLFFEEVEE